SGAGTRMDGSAQEARRDRKRRDDTFGLGLGRITIPGSPRIAPPTALHACRSRRRLLNGAAMRLIAWSGHSGAGQAWCERQVRTLPDPPATIEDEGAHARPMKMPRYGDPSVPRRRSGKASCATVLRSSNEDGLDEQIGAEGQIAGYGLPLARS